MKKTITLLGIAALFAGLSMASTETIDLNLGSGTVIEKTHNIGTELTGSEANAWLAGTTGWQITTQGGKADMGTNPNNKYTEVDTIGTSVTFVSPQHESLNGGWTDTSVYIGCAYTLSSDIDLSSVESLTLNYAANDVVNGETTYTKDNNAVSYGVYLVYGTQSKDSDEILWTAMKGETIQRGDSASLIVTPTDLASDTFYIVANADAKAWGISNMDFTMTAEVVPTTEVVPEPATATLSLLALAGLAARRRRK